MKLDIIKWKDFYLSDVFTKIEPGKVSQAYQLEEGVDIPYLGAKKDDNGIMAWCEANEGLKSKGNCVVLICDGQGSVGLANYMESDFLGTVMIEILEYYILLEIGFVETNGELKKKITERWGNVSQHLDILAASKKREML